MRLLCLEDRAKAASQAGPFTKYLFSCSNVNNNNFDWNQPCTYLLALEHMSRRLTLFAYDRFDLLQRKKGLVKEVAWNETSIDWVKVSNIYNAIFNFKIFWLLAHIHVRF